MYERRSRALIRSRCSAIDRGGLDLLRRDPGDDLGSSGADDGADPGRRVGIGRVALAQVAGEVDLRRIDVLDRQPLDLSGGIDDLDGAPVPDPRDGEAGHAPEGLLVVEQFAEHGAGFGEEALVLLGAHAGGDVMEGVDRELGRAVRTGQGRRLDDRPVLLTAASNAEADRERLRRASGERVPAGQVGSREWPTVLGEQFEASEDLLGGRGKECFGRREADDGGRHFVRVHQAAGSILHRHPVGDRAQDLLEPVSHRGGGNAMRFFALGNLVDHAFPLYGDPGRRALCISQSLEYSQRHARLRHIADAFHGPSAFDPAPSVPIDSQSAATRVTSRQRVAREPPVHARRAP